MLSVPLRAVLLVGLANGLRTVHYSTRLSSPHSPSRLASPRCCATPPPPLEDGSSAFQSGAFEVEGTQLWWRQSDELMQVIVALPEDLSIKKEASIEISRKSISVTLSGVAVLCGDLAHDVYGEGSDWVVEDELDGFDGTRFLVIDLRKRESFVDWAAPLAANGVGGGAARSLVIGGKGEAQKRATGRQFASYQILQKLPSNVRSDVYARAPRGLAGVVQEEVGEMRLHFVGKVVAEGSAEAPAAATQAAALAAQEVLVKEHARLLTPDIFSTLSDEQMELWLAPGNSEMAVAQNAISMKRWIFPPPEGEVRVELPTAGACGFEPATPPPEHMGAPSLSVRRSEEGRPLGASVEANIMSPDEVPGAFEAYIKDK